MKKMAEQSMTYSGAGVDITKGNQAVELMKPLVKSTFRKEVATDLGGFGGLFAMIKINMKNQFWFLALTVLAQN